MKSSKKFFRFLRIPKHTIVEFARDEVKTGLFSINRICKLCGISKNTFYDSKDPNDRLREKYAKIKKKVEKIIRANPGYGIRRIKKELEDKFRASIGRDTLAKMLLIWGFENKRKVKKKKRNLIQKILIKLKDKTNILVRSTINNPFEAVTSDITELKFKQGKCYLCVHKDVIGQMVYGFDVSQNMQTELVMNSLKMAIQRIKKLNKKIPDKIIFHQDQGSQYTSYEYVNESLKYGRLSFSTPGTPTDNPGQESFFGRFKDEWKDEIVDLESFKEVEKFIKDKINYYNNKRLHTSIDYQTPLKFTKLYLKLSK